jgi:hypothetical protein
MDRNQLAYLLLALIPLTVLATWRYATRHRRSEKRRRDL